MVKERDDVVLGPERKMGKRNRKTRWRTLTMADEQHSDSEESTTASGLRLPKTYQSKSYYGRFTYSSQSTPTRRYQYDGTKSTRSSSTASENKITFNEDEYTRITTPRQDVLFKKGYLNKPKNYQTQTSTGTSTTSTGNSTGNGTPDHQSTDLDYESSQFVFPNGFVDQNGIYYVNSFEPYPLMLYNPPTYYPEFTNNKSKRCSTGSLTESTSPNNEEACQDETPSNVSDFNPAVYNVVYPGYYFNNSGGECQSQDATDQSRRSKKKKRRRTSSRSTSASSESSDEISSDESPKEEKESVDAQQMLLKSLVKENSAEETTVMVDDCPKLKYDLKPDAEEFVPRAYRPPQPETIPVVDPNVQFIKLPPNFVPVPILNPLDEFNGQNFSHPAFMQPTGIPINFIPQNYVNFATSYEKTKENEEHEEKEKEEEIKQEEATQVPNVISNNQTNRIDIAKIVLKLEKAAKEQDGESTETKKEQVTEDKPLAPSSSPIKKNFDRNLRRNRYQTHKIEEEKRKNNNNSEWKKPSWKQNNSSPRHETNKTASNGLPPKIPTKNYSETLKKPLAKPLKTGPPKKEETVVKNEPPKSPNQWISVSNRKKRRSRNVEETEDFEELDDSDLFESYDVSLLQDVVVETKQEERISEKVQVVVEEEILVAPKEEVKKKKSKKGSKVAPKRVIITDVDLSVDKTVVVEEEKKEKSLPLPVPVEAIEETVVEQVIKTVEEKKVEAPEKKVKNKKKKSKTTKLDSFNSQSSSNATLNVLEDSYDFLLETSILDESERTNVEISHELDKMIQRGMYSSLEEKFKSLNMVETNDGFFKTIINNISSREPSVEKNNYMKAPDFTKILKNTLIPKPVILETDPNGLVAEASNSKCDDFLETTLPTLEETKTHVDPIESHHTETAIIEIAPSKDDKLYPITQAVKEWMTKTRENTPEVEILKSPSTIFKEFYLEAGDKNVNTTTTNQLQSRSSSLTSSRNNVQVDAEDEITIFTKENGGSDDPLEYWEDGDFVKTTIEQGEDVLVYESKYGKNEDFLRIKKEVEEKKMNGVNYPKHGNLPYRAICCSIM